MTSNVIRRYASPVYPLGSIGFKLEPRTIDQLRRDERSADFEDESLDTGIAMPVAEDDRAPLATRMRVVFALSALSWLVVALIAFGIIEILRAI
jgi:hypothetical protein